MAKVKQFTCFHFSPRYTKKGHLLLDEAKNGFESYRFNVHETVTSEPLNL